VVVPGNVSVGVWTLPLTARVDVALTGPAKVVVPLNPIPLVTVTALAVRTPVSVGLAFGARLAPESVKSSAVPPSVKPSGSCNPLIFVPNKLNHNLYQPVQSQLIRCLVSR
jgi:hypothetical protein